MAAFNTSGTTLLNNAAFDQSLSQLFSDDMALMAAVRQTMLDQAMNGMSSMNAMNGMRAGSM
jgi:hypothetical protein